MNNELLRQVEIALANMVSYQSSGNSPSIHEYGQARRTLEAVRAAQSPSQPLVEVQEPGHWAKLRELGWTLQDCRVCGESAGAMTAPVRGLPLTEERFSYHDVVVSFGDKKIPLFDASYGLMLTCTRAGGWELWNRWGGTEELLAGEFNEVPLTIEVAGHAILRSKPSGGISCSAPGGDELRGAENV